jgi:hypothetical protein
VHADEKTEPDQATPVSDSLAGQTEDPTEHQPLVPSDERTEQQRRPLSEQPTIALPDAAVPPSHEPPTVVLPEGGIVPAAADPEAVVDHTERTPMQPGDAEPPPVAAGDPPTVADRHADTIRRTGPRRVPGYQLLERLGAGTYGEVWLAQDERTGIRVAIKFLNQGTDVEWQLIQAEVKQLALLHADPGIVQLLGVELERRPPYYIMAYAEQGSLANRLERGPLPLAEALDLFRQLAEALAYVHAKGVRHCDLKPGNVMLKARKRALIGDFGQAHLSSEQAPALGTFFYMAPEQATLAKQIPDTRWDVYGLGAIFYAMLTGQPPREEAAVREELAHIDDLAERLLRYRTCVEKAPKPDLHRRVAGMDRYLAEIVDRCLEVSPVRRLRDAGSILAALARREHLLRQRPLLVFGFLAQVILCLVLGGLGFLGVHLGIERAEASLLERLDPGDPNAAMLVRGGMSELRWDMIRVGIAITAAVTVVLSALWGWLIWRLRHKEQADQEDAW